MRLYNCNLFPFKQEVVHGKNWLMSYAFPEETEKIIGYFDEIKKNVDDMNLYCAAKGYRKHDMGENLGINDQFQFIHELYSYDGNVDLNKKDINNMILYNAAKMDGNYDIQFKNEGLRNRLLSYADIDAVKGAFQFWLNPELKEKRLFLDSGAYSAFTRGVEIDLDAYIEFVKKWENEIEVYAGLDVIGDHKKTLENIQYMESKGLKPLPTFHHGEPFDFLEFLCKNYKYIAIGGMAQLGRSRPKFKKWLDQCWVIMKKYFPIKVHGFALTSQWVLEQYPFYSVDSTSAIMGGGMGRIINFQNGKLEHSDWQEQGKQGKLLNCVDRFDVDGSAHLSRRIHNIIQMMKFEEYITSLWAKRGVVWDD